MSTSTNLWIAKSISVVLIILTTLFGASIGTKIFRDSKGKDSLLLHLSICFTSSVFISVAFIHLLPDSIQAFKDSGIHLTPSGSDHSIYQLLFTTACAGLFLAELVEYYSRHKADCPDHSHSHKAPLILVDEEQFRAQDDQFQHHELKEKDCLPHEHSMIHAEESVQRAEAKTMPIVLVTLLSFHSFVAGLALGASASTDSVILVLIAIVAHKWAESLAICYEFEAHRVSRRESFQMLGVYSFMTPFGIVLAALTTGFLQNQTAVLCLQSVLIAFTTGVFLYTGLSHLEESNVYSGRYKLQYKAASLFAGLALMLIVSFWA